LIIITAFITLFSFGGKENPLWSLSLWLSATEALNFNYYNIKVEGSVAWFWF